MDNPCERCFGRKSRIRIRSLQEKWRGINFAEAFSKKILDKNYILETKIKGKDLKGLKYQGPFDDLPRVKKVAAEKPETFHTVVLDKDLVTEVEGTGIVHCAPGAGEEDFKIGQREKLAVIDVIDEAAVYLDGMDDLSGKMRRKIRK